MQQTTHAPQPQGSTPPDPEQAIGRRAAMTLVRTAAAGMAGWSLYVVARHYELPRPLAAGAGLVFDGAAYLALRMATDAMRAGRSAAAPISATIAMAATSVYLNLVHARFTGGGRPAEVLYASPAVALLLVSVLSWAAERAAARAERGETPMRMPAYGALGWVLARGQAYDALKEKAVAHVTSGAPSQHQPASLPAGRTAEDVIAAEFAEIGPAAAVQRVAAANPGATDAEIAAILADYQVTLTPGHVALLLERAAPTVKLDRMADPEKPPAALEQAADPAVRAAVAAVCAVLGPDATPAQVADQLVEARVITDPEVALRRVTAQMVRDGAHHGAPQVTGKSKAEAITEIAEWCGDGAPADLIVQVLAHQAISVSDGHVRNEISRAAARARRKASPKIGFGAP
ncbi:hypothetical protein [Kitasatospora sp. NPDC005748]|uniref:hypothetical protein n=1 Tax=Kitasatospora sp. NPDC005748 TaxID=3157063 RepID=UPI0033C71597